jgi:hypothetical protein
MEIVESNPSVMYTTYYPHFVYQQSELSDHGLASELYFDQTRTFLTMVGHGVNGLFGSSGSLFIKVRGLRF